MSLVDSPFILLLVDFFFPPKNLSLRPLPPLLSSHCNDEKSPSTVYIDAIAPSEKYREHGFRYIITFSRCIRILHKNRTVYRCLCAETWTETRRLHLMCCVLCCHLMAFHHITHCRRSMEPTQSARRNTTCAVNSQMLANAFRHLFATISCAADGAAAAAAANP